MGTSLMCFRAGFQILFGVEGKVIIFTAFIFYAYIAHPFRTALLQCVIMIYNEVWGNAKRGIPLAGEEAVNMEDMQNSFDAKA